MSRYINGKNTSRHPVALASGRMLGVGEWGTLDSDDPHDRALLAAKAVTGEPDPPRRPPPERGRGRTSNAAPPAPPAPPDDAPAAGGKPAKPDTENEGV